MHPGVVLEKAFKGADESNAQASYPPAATSRASALLNEASRSTIKTLGPFLASESFVIESGSNYANTK
ncbi:hypothetical protein AABE10_02690 [Paraburkholderia diazotrophica]